MSESEAKTQAISLLANNLIDVDEAIAELLVLRETTIPRAAVAAALAELWAEFEQKHYLNQDSALDILRDTIFELKLDTEVDEAMTKARKEITEVTQ